MNFGKWPGKLFPFSDLIEQLKVQAEVILRSRNDLEDIRIVGIDLTRRDVRHRKQGQTDVG